MEGKRRVSDIVNPLVLTLRDRDIPSNPIVVRLLLSQTMPLPSTDQLRLNTSASFLQIGEPMDGGTHWASTISAMTHEKIAVGVGP